MLSIRKSLRRHQSERGFTLVEVTIILLVLVIISMIMLPQLGNFNRLARKVKVMEDLGALCATLKKFLDEVMVNAFWELPGGANAAPSGARIGLLHGPGQPPTDPNTAAFHNVVTPDSPWALSADGTSAIKLQVAPDAPGAVGGPTLNFAVDRLENHLQINDPFGDGSPQVISRYKNTSEDALEAVHFFLSWKGPYFDAISEDPWGTRYLVNAFGLHSVSDANLDPSFRYFTTAVVCFSAGPDKTTSTKINQPMDTSPYGWVTGGDDFAVVLSAGGPF